MKFLANPATFNSDRAAFGRNWSQKESIASLDRHQQTSCFENCCWKTTWVALYLLGPSKQIFGSHLAKIGVKVASLRLACVTHFDYFRLVSSSSRQQVKVRVISRPFSSSDLSCQRKSCERAPRLFRRTQKVNCDPNLSTFTPPKSY